MGHRKHETEVHELANFKQKICKIEKKYIWFSDEILYLFLISDEIQCFFWFPGEIPELIFGFKSLSEKFSVF